MGLVVVLFEGVSVVVSVLATMHGCTEGCACACTCLGCALCVCGVLGKGGGGAVCEVWGSTSEEVPGVAVAVSRVL
jgi:hypothetical protein